MSLFKSICLVLAVLCGLFLGGLFLIPHLVDVEHLKPVIEREVKQRLGITVTIGSLHLYTLGRLGLSAKNIEVKNPEGFSKTSALTLPEAIIRVQLFPLLKLKLIGDIIFYTPKLHVEKGPSGEWNWQRLLSMSVPAKPEKTSISEKRKGSTLVGSNPHFQKKTSYWANFLRKARFSFQIRKWQVIPYAEEVNIVFSEMKLYEEIPFKLHAHGIRFTYLSEPIVNPKKSPFIVLGALDMSGTVGPVASLDQLFPLSVNFLADLTELQMATPLGKKMFKENTRAKVRLSFDEKGIDIRSLSLDWKALVLNAKGHFFFSDRRVTLEGHSSQFRLKNFHENVIYLNQNKVEGLVQLHLFQFEGILADRKTWKHTIRLSVEEGRNFWKTVHSPFQLEVDLKTDGKAIILKRAYLMTGVSQMIFSGKISHRSKKPTLDMKVVLNPVDLEELGQFLPVVGNYQPRGKVVGQGKIVASLRPLVLHDFQGTLDLRDGEASPPQFPLPLSNVDLKILMTPKAYTLKRFDFRYGRSHVQGRAHYLRHAKTSNFLIFGDELLMEEVLLVKRGLAMEGKKGGTVSPTKALAFLEHPILQKIKGRGRIQFGKVHFNNTSVSDLDVGIRFSPRMLEISPLSFQLAGGKVLIWNTVDLRGKEPKFTAHVAVRNLDTGQFLLTRRSSAYEKFSGAFFGKFSFETKGWNRERLLKHLKGKGLVQLREGQFSLFNLSDAVLNKLPDTGPLKLFSSELSVVDHYTLIQSTIIIKDQKIQTPNVVVRGSGGRAIECSGYTGFDKRISYSGTYYLVSKKDIQISVPFEVKGTLDNPMPIPNVRRVITGLMTETGRKLFSREQAIRAIGEGLGVFGELLPPLPF